MSQPAASRTGPRLAAAGLAFALVATVAGAGWQAAAQQSQSIPGITIVSPSAGQQPAGPPQGIPGVMMQPMAPPPQASPQAPPPQAAPPQAKPAAPRKAAPRKEVAATSESGESGPSKGTGPTRIAVLVNGEPVTAYEIEQRARLMALGEGAQIQSQAQANMKALATSESVTTRWKQIVDDTVRQNQATKSRDQIMAMLQERQKQFAMGLQKQAVESARASSIPKMRQKAREELVEEQLKLQDARSNKASPDEAMVDDLIKDIGQRNKMTPQQFTTHFAGMGVDIATLKARFRAQLAWTNVVRRQYSHLANPSNLDIDRLIQNTSTKGEDQVELQLQRIIVPVPPKIDQKAMAQRLADAEGLQRQFTRCNMVSILANKIPGSRHENMGARRLSTFEEPTRSMLSNASSGSMLPPSITSGGIELFAVCDRRVIKALDEARSEAQNKAMQEELERRSRGRLRFLKETAVIENR